MGYMEGALHSGAAVARRIADARRRRRREPRREGAPRGGAGRSLLGLLVAVCTRDRGQRAIATTAAPASAARDRRIDEQLAPASAPAGARRARGRDSDRRLGQHERDASPATTDGTRPKIDIARRAARDLVDQFARYADEHKDEPVLLGALRVQPAATASPTAGRSCRWARPIARDAEAALDAVRPDGGTPIGDAMIAAKRELDATGLSRRHLLVVTDGENTDGFAPERVAAAIGRRPEAERPSIYFVAFDIEASQFARRPRRRRPGARRRQRARAERHARQRCCAGRS